MPSETRKDRIHSGRLIQHVLWFVPTFIFSAYVFMALHEGFASIFKLMLADSVSLIYLSLLAIAISMIHAGVIFLSDRLQRPSPALIAIIGGSSGFLLLGVRRELLNGSGPLFARTIAREIPELLMVITCLGFSIASIFLLSSVYRKPITG
jgi:hypothetical protein